VVVLWVRVREDSGSAWGDVQNPSRGDREAQGGAPGSVPWVIFSVEDVELGKTMSRNSIGAFVLGILITGAAWAWAERHRMQTAIQDGNDRPYIYRQDRTAFLFECTVWDGARRVAVLVPISEAYPCYTAPAIVWTMPYAKFDKVLDHADRLHKEGLSCLYVKYHDYVQGPPIPGAREEDPPRGQ
jgi:hypothetical protein